MRLFFASSLMTLLSVVSVAPLASAAGGELDELLAGSCKTLIAKTDARMSEGKAELATLEQAKKNLRDSFIYPNTKSAYLSFAAAAPSIHSLLSAQTLEIGGKYNLLEMQVTNATNIPAELKTTMKDQLRETHMNPLILSIRVDLLAAGYNTSINGNWVEFTKAGTTYGVFYKPTGAIPALAIRGDNRFESVNRSADGKIDPLTSVTVRIQQVYNPYNKQVWVTPKSFDPADLEAFFTEKEFIASSGYSFFMSPLENEAKAKAVSPDSAAHQTCKSLAK